MKKLYGNFFRFFLTVLPFVELSDYISMSPDKKIKHRLRKEHGTVIESVNNPKSAS